MNNCPCCSSIMFRQIRNEKIYWFCPSCYQEMPNLVDILRQEKQKYASTMVGKKLIAK